MSKVKWLPQAIADVERLQVFLLDKDSKAASQAAYLIFQAVLRLETSPRIGRPMLDATGRRELFIPFGAGAYVLRYILEDKDKAIVIRVWHSRESRG